MPRNTGWNKQVMSDHSNDFQGLFSPRIAAYSVTRTYYWRQSMVSNFRMRRSDRMEDFFFGNNGGSKEICLIMIWRNCLEALSAERWNPRKPFWSVLLLHGNGRDDKDTRKWLQLSILWYGQSGGAIHWSNASCNTTYHEPKGSPIAKAYV